MIDSDRLIVKRMRILGQDSCQYRVIHVDAGQEVDSDGRQEHHP
jgi:hypothetical protein